MPNAFFSEVASAWKSKNEIGCLASERLENGVGQPERVVERFHEGSAQQVGDADPAHAASADKDAIAFAGGPRRVIGRAQQARLPVKVLHDVPLAPGVVAKSDDVHAGLQQAAGDVRRDSVSCGRVLAIDDDEVRRVQVMQGRQHRLNGVSAAFSDNVAEHQYSHGA